MAIPCAWANAALCGRACLSCSVFSQKAGAACLDPVGLGGQEGSNKEGCGEDGEEDGWITPSNIQQFQECLGHGKVPESVKVGCVTTDFAMQAREGCLSLDLGAGEGS